MSKAIAEQPVQEKRSLKAHENLIFITIQRQAGTLAKAITELIMNSVDAGSKNISIKLTKNQVVIVDDGVGFDTRDKIEKCFEVFGQPHEMDKNGNSTDATFGTFRIGRGQIFAFAKSVWRSGVFEMNVDIKGKGLDYMLTEGMKNSPGCSITNTLYESLSPMQLASTTKEVEHFVKFVTIPILLNGQQISAGADSVKWDHVTDDAFIQIHSTQTKGIEIYNQGVWVETLSGWVHGVAGLVVSKKPLRLNTARNQVMQSCPVFKRVLALLGKKTKEKLKKKLDLSDEERIHLMQLIRAGAERLRNNLSSRLFRDVTDHGWSISQISALRKKLVARDNGRAAISCTHEGDILGDKTQSDGAGFILSEEDAIMLGFRSGTAMIKWMLDSSILARSYDYVPFKELTKNVTRNYSLIEAKNLTAREKLVLEVLDGVEGTIRYNQARAGLFEYADMMGRERTMRLGIGPAQAWTDGVSYVAFNRKTIKDIAVLDEGAWYDLVGILIHELCHDGDTSGTHLHTPKFYKDYHDMQIHQAANVGRKAFQEFLKRSTTARNRLPQQLQRDVTMDEEVIYNEEILKRSLASALKPEQSSVVEKK